MLIIDRYKGETLNIGDDTTVTVLDIRRGQVRLGISAPRSIPVHREEIYLRIVRFKVDRSEISYHSVLLRSAVLLRPLPGRSC